MRLLHEQQSGLRFGLCFLKRPQRECDRGPLAMDESLPGRVSFAAGTRQRWRQRSEYDFIALSPYRSTSSAIKAEVVCALLGDTPLQPHPCRPNIPLVDGVSELNKRKVRLFIEAVWNERRLELIDELVGADYTGRFAPVLSGAIGREELRGLVSSRRRICPGLHIKIDDQIAEDDRVVTRWQMAATLGTVSLPAPKRLYAVPFGHLDHPSACRQTGRVPHRMHDGRQPMSPSHSTGYSRLTVGAIGVSACAAGATCALYGLIGLGPESPIP